MCIFPRILEVSQFFLPIFFNNLKSPFLMASVQSQFSPVGPRLRRGVAQWRDSGHAPGVAARALCAGESAETT